MLTTDLQAGVSTALGEVTSDGIELVYMATLQAMYYLILLILTQTLKQQTIQSTQIGG